MFETARIISMIAEISLTFTEIIYALTLFGGIIAIWVSIEIKLTRLSTENRLKIEGLRTEFELKIKAIDSKTMGLADFMAQRLKEFVEDNKGDHNEIKSIVDNITKKMNEIGITVAKITPYQHGS